VYGDPVIPRIAFSRPEREYTISYLLLATARFLNMALPGICE